MQTEIRLQYKYTTTISIRYESGEFYNQSKVRNNLSAIPEISTIIPKIFP